MDPIMVKIGGGLRRKALFFKRSWPHPHQIHLSDTQIRETTRSHITIQYEAFNNYFYNIASKFV